MTTPNTKSNRQRLRVALLTTAVSVAVALSVAAYTLTGRDRSNPVPPIPPLDLSAAPRELVQAFSRARQRVLSEPRSHADWGRLGELFLRKKFYVEASECFGRAAVLNHSEWRWFYFAGIATENSDLDCAIDFYREAASLRRDYVPLQVRYGLALERAGRFDDALTCWEHVLELTPNHYEARLGLGRLALSRNDLATALQQLHPAASFDPERREAHILLIPLFHRLADHAAAEYHQECLEKCPQHASTLSDPVFAKIWLKPL